MLDERTRGRIAGLGAEAPSASIVLVAGSGRSGTSLFSGILQRIGYRVAQPEVPADATNPRGFAESQWVVDFHTRLLAAAGVGVSDARPGAWARTARVGLDPEVANTLRRWLETQLGESSRLVVKDPRLSWFLPLWRRCAEDLGAAPSCVTLLRHPAAVIASKQRSYGGWQGDVSRAAGWLNQTLFTERATRDAARAFVPYDALLADWTQVLAGVDAALGLALLRDVPVASLRAVHAFVDQGLSRSRADWSRLELPDVLRADTDGAWRLMSRLAADGAPDPAETLDRLDAARAAYVERYAEAEAIARSSIVAARRTAPAHGRLPGSAAALIRRVPTRYRRRVPARWRAGVARGLRGLNGAGR